MGQFNSVQEFINYLVPLAKNHIKIMEYLHL